MVDGSMFQEHEACLYDRREHFSERSKIEGIAPSSQETRRGVGPQRQEAVWNWAWRYDLFIGLATLGREQAFRRRVVPFRCSSQYLFLTGVVFVAEKPR